MTTTQVMAKQMGMISTGLPNYSARSEQVSADFESTLSKSMKSDSSTKDASISDSTRLNAKTNANTKSDKDVKTSGSSEKETVKESASKDTSSVKSRSEQTKTGQAAGTDKDIAVDEELTENMEALIEAGLQIVAEFFNLTPEELKQMMSDLDLAPEDLLTQDGLTDIFLQQNNLSDVTDLLIHQDAANKLNELLQTVDSVIKEADLPVPVEEFHSILTKLNEANPVVQNAEVGNKDEHLDVKDADLQKTTEGKATEENRVFQDEKVTIEVQSNKTGSKDDNSKGAKEQGKSETENFIEHLTYAKQPGEVTMEPDVAKLQQYREIVSQIVEQVKIHISEAHTTMQMNLNPESLGKVQVSVSNKNGVMNASFLVQNETAKEAIENQMHTLIKTFDEQGLKVQSVEVSVSDFGFQENFNQTMSEGNENQNQKENHQNRRSITLEDAIHMDDLTEDEQMIAKLMEQYGNQVDYTA